MTGKTQQAIHQIPNSEPPALEPYLLTKGQCNWGLHYGLYACYTCRKGVAEDLSGLNFPYSYYPVESFLELTFEETVDFLRTQVWALNTSFLFCCSLSPYIVNGWINNTGKLARKLLTKMHFITCIEPRWGLHNILHSEISSINYQVRNPTWRTLFLW